MASLSYSDITVTVVSKRRLVNKQQENLVKLVFGDASKTYPSGGITITSDAFRKSLGLSSPLRYLIPVSHRNSTSAIVWQHDYLNGTLRAYNNGHVPQIIIEEAVTLTSNAGTLKYPPAYIICAVGTISATVTPLRPVPASATLATKEFNITWSSGAVTTKASDSVTSMAVSYIPQQPSGPFSYANMAVDEVITLATGGVNSASRAMAVQYLYQTAATAKLQAFGHTASGTDVGTLDINNSTATTFTCAAGNDTKAAVVTYLKYSGFANNASTVFVDQGTVSLSSQVKEWTYAAGDLKCGGLLIPSSGVQIVSNETTNYVNTYLGDSTVTAAAGIVKYEIAKQKITTAETIAKTAIVDQPFMYLSPWFIGNADESELTVNDAPSSTTLYFHAIA